MNREQIATNAVLDWLEENPHIHLLDAEVAVLAARMADALLPQITTVEQLDALDPDTWLIGTLIVGGPGFWTADGIPEASRKAYLDTYGPFTIWQAQP